MKHSTALFLLGLSSVFLGFGILKHFSDIGGFYINIWQDTMNSSLKFGESLAHILHLAILSWLQGALIISSTFISCRRQVLSQENEFVH